jgi:hypothetical protein
MLMRNLVLLSASALVLALGLASASAEPRTEDVMNHGNFGVTQTYAPHASVYEGRSAFEFAAPAANVLNDQSHHSGR